MKTTNPMMFVVLTAILKLLSLGLTQVAITSDQIAAFNALLRDFDLNKETQNGYAITAAEYEQLKAAWKGLLPSDQHQLLSCDLWTGTYVKLLLYDLNDDKSWEAHINKMTHCGAQGFSLTLSRCNSPMTVTNARKMLADLLHKGPSMFSDARLRITEEFKVQAAERAGDEARQRLEKWEQLINECQNRLDMDKLKAVNRFFNRQIMGRNDEGKAKKCDYWQSPIETLVRGIGDCDDYAMAKYVSLRLLGISPEQLRVLMVKYPGIGGHVVLLFYPPNEKDPWVLDNLTFEHFGYTDSHILRLSERIELHAMKPIFGINENQLTAFQEGLNEKVTNADPCHSCPKFGIALMNSQRVLPQTHIKNRSGVSQVYVSTNSQ